MNEAQTVFVGDVAFNRDITPEADITSVGGAAYYSAVGAATASQKEGLPSDIGIVAPVGDDFDLESLIQKGIDVLGVPVILGGKTCRFTVTQHRDSTRDFTADRFVAEKVDTDIFPKPYYSAKRIHLPTSLPQNYIIWSEFLSDKTDATLSADAFEPFSLEFPDLTISALNRMDLIFINEDEANILSQHGQLNTDVPWVLKRGAGGVSYLEGSKEIRVHAPKVDAIETTGAGDTLAGAFLTLLANEYEVEQALTIAVSVASQSVTKFGVEHLLEDK